MCEDDETVPLDDPGYVIELPSQERQTAAYLNPYSEPASEPCLTPQPIVPQGEDEVDTACPVTGASQADKDYVIPSTCVPPNAEAKEAASADVREQCKPHAGHYLIYCNQWPWVV